jgi:SAM-dependent methyltransferase
MPEPTSRRASLRLAARYDGLADWYDREVRRLQLTTTATETLARLLGPGAGRCLDLGCGSGVAVPAVAGLGWRVVGIDLSGDQLRVAREQAGALPFDDGSFEAVVSLMTHTDLDDPGSAFAEAARVLQSGGRFVYVGPHPASSRRSLSAARPAATCCTPATGSVAGDVMDRASVRASGRGLASTTCRWLILSVPSWRPGSPSGAWRNRGTRTIRS